MAKVPLAEQIDEALRIIHQTGESVKSGALLPELANERFPRQFAILATLQWLEANEDRIKQALKRETR